MKSLNISRAVIAVMLIVVHVAVVSCLKKVKPKEIPLNLCSIDHSNQRFWLPTALQRDLDCTCNVDIYLVRRNTVKR